FESMKSPNTVRWIAASVIGFLLVAGLSAQSGPKNQQNSMTREDENAIKATIEAYRTAWLANDVTGVLRTFTDDAVLLPAHGAPAVVGMVAIEKYWFTPGGPLTTITELNITVDQMGGSGTIGFARGLDAVGWTVRQD